MAALDRAPFMTLARLPTLSRLIPQLALGVALALVAPAFLMLFGRLDAGLAPVAIAFPACLAAGLIGGWRAGAACMLVSVAFIGGVEASGRIGGEQRLPLAGLLYVACCGSMVWAGAQLHQMVIDIRRTQDDIQTRNLSFDTLFSTISEGFAICEAIRDADGRLVDYQVEEMNPALRRMLGVGEQRTGRLSDAPGDFTHWLAACDKVLTTGEPAVIERPQGVAGRWHEVRISRLTGTKMAQLFIDITARKTQQARQAELFDELNHRVKNNLAIVSGVLSTQARGAQPLVAEELLKAVGRVHSISDLHASLYKTHQTTEVELGVYLRELCDSLSRSLIADGRIQLNVEAPVFRVHVDHAVPVGLIVSELVTNAVKYAYPGGETGEIRVRLERQGSGAALFISDDGAGLPDGQAGAASGLGMRLVRSMISQLGGEMTVHSGPGARFEITLPHPEPRSEKR